MEPGNNRMTGSLTAVRRREADIEASRRGIVRWEGEAEQPSLAALDDCAGEIQEIRRLNAAILQNADPAIVLKDVLRSGIGRILHESNWPVQATRNNFSPQCLRVDDDRQTHQDGDYRRA
jgi:hypothetical protein